MKLVCGKLQSKFWKLNLLQRISLIIETFPKRKLSKYLKDGIFELRIKLLNTISRSLYFFIEGKTIIFTHGFIKKTEKTPNSEIEKAKFIKKLYKGN